MTTSSFLPAISGSALLQLPNLAELMHGCADKILNKDPLSSFSKEEMNLLHFFATDRLVKDSSLISQSVAEALNRSSNQEVVQSYKRKALFIATHYKDFCVPSTKHSQNKYHSFFGLYSAISKEYFEVFGAKNTWLWHDPFFNILTSMLFLLELDDIDDFIKSSLEKPSGPSFSFMVNKSYYNVNPVFMTFFILNDNLLYNHVVKLIAKSELKTNKSHKVLSLFFYRNGNLSLILREAIRLNLAKQEKLNLFNNLLLLSEELLKNEDFSYRTKDLERLMQIKVNFDKFTNMNNDKAFAGKLLEDKEWLYKFLNIYFELPPVAFSKEDLLKMPIGRRLKVVSRVFKNSMLYGKQSRLKNAIKKKKAYNPLLDITYEDLKLLMFEGMFKFPVKVKNILELGFKYLKREENA